MSGGWPGRTGHSRRAESAGPGRRWHTAPRRMRRTGRRVPVQGWIRRAAWLRPSGVCIRALGRLFRPGNSQPVETGSRRDWHITTSSCSVAGILQLRCGRHIVTSSCSVAGTFRPAARSAPHFQILRRRRSSAAPQAASLPVPGSGTAPHPTWMWSRPTID